MVIKKTKEKGFVDTVLSFVTYPLKVARDFTIPMVEDGDWNRNRAAIVPILIPTAISLLCGVLDFGTVLLLTLPCLMLGIYIRVRTSISEPPNWLLNSNSAIAFVMSVVWISFASNCIIDLLRLMGLITGLPTATLALTILSWGNCLGDLTADVAMTKKGFGEMAITGALAGPIFNILIANGLSMTLTLLQS